MKIYFTSRDLATRAQSALEEIGLDAGDPQMTQPVQSRTWLVEVEASLSETKTLREAILQIVNRYDGVVKTAPESARPGGAPFVNNLPQSVIDRHESSRKR